MRVTMADENTPSHLSPQQHVTTTQKNDRDHNSVCRLLPEIVDHHGDALICVKKCLWLILIPSCVLITLLSWDIAGDQEGWRGSYWIGISGISIMITVWSIDFMIDWRT